MRNLIHIRLIGLLGLASITAPAAAQSPTPAGTQAVSLTKTYLEEETEVVPTYQGGPNVLREWLKQKTIVPQFPVKNQFGGTVDVEFVLRPDGSFDSLHVANPVCCGMDEEALRVVGLTAGKWAPGQVQGTPVRTRVEVNVPFKVANQTSISAKKLEEMRKLFASHSQTPEYRAEKAAYEKQVAEQK